MSDVDPVEAIAKVLTAWADPKMDPRLAKALRLDPYVQARAVIDAIRTDSALRAALLAEVV